MKTIMTLAILIAAFVIQSPAQDTLSLSIDKAIEIGLENSKALKSSEFKVIAADAKASESDTYGLPSLKFQGAYTRLSDIPPSQVTVFGNTFTLSPTILDNYTLKGTIQQPLFTGGKLSGAADAAEYSAEATKHDFGKDKADVRYNIKAAYWNLYGAIEVSKFVDDNVSQIRSHVTDAENLMKQGMLTTNDILKVQVQLSDALVRQINAKNGVQLAMIALDNTLGLPLSTYITLTSTIEVKDRSWSAVDQLINHAFEKRPDILAMNARVKASEAGLSSARGGWWPQVYLVGDYNYLKPNQRIFPAQNKFKDTWDVSVSVSFDIWNWNQTGDQTTQAQAQVSQTQEGLSMLKDGVTLEVTQNYLSVNQARERQLVSEQGVAQAEENYRVMKEKYKTGLIPNLELKDAETALLQAKLNLTQSKVDYELAMARLSKAIGE